MAQSTKKNSRIGQSVWLKFKIKSKSFFFINWTECHYGQKKFTRHLFLHRHDVPLIYLMPCKSVPIHEKITYSSSLTWTTQLKKMLDLSIFTAMKKVFCFPKNTDLLEFGTQNVFFLEDVINQTVVSYILDFLVHKIKEFLFKKWHSLRVFVIVICNLFLQILTYYAIVFLCGIGIGA